jgi:acetoacetyl-CoA synthetase
MRTLWTPSQEQIDRSQFRRYCDWIEQTRGLRFEGYHDLWRWSVDELEAFWGSLWEYFAIDAATPFTSALDARTMPGARWFEGATLSYMSHALRHHVDERPAIIFASERDAPVAISGVELRRRVAAAARWMRDAGITKGDRVAVYLPNVPEAVIAFLAAASIGAVWSCCSPDFGAESVVERFAQIEPSLLVAADGYRYAGRSHDRLDVVAELRRSLPSVRATVLVGCLDPAATLDGTIPWSSLLERDAELDIADVPFDHPLWILYSSGTTGIPKAIVHGHGGIILEHLKALALQSDVGVGDRIFWYTTTGWMMWNRLVGGLLAGASILLYDGSPAWPDHGALWRLAADARVTHFGAGAGYFAACSQAGLEPKRVADLSSLRMISSTGSPLADELYEWIYDAVKSDVWLASSSGGTDVATAFLGACPTLPVVAGELQGRALGVAAEAWDEEGNALVDAVGELVITAPMPSMPLYFWGDHDGERYHESYFEPWPGVWRHGDWVRFTEWGSAVILGRSDATLNRHGVRMGTSEIYRAVESIEGVAEALAVGLELEGGGYSLLLFVALRKGTVLDDALREEIRRRIRSECSPRHVPDEIIAVGEIPRTLNGKKLEVPVKRILMGMPAASAVNAGSLANPESLRFFIDLARTRALRPAR